LFTARQHSLFTSKICLLLELIKRQKFGAKRYNFPTHGCNIEILGKWIHIFSMRQGFQNLNPALRYFSHIMCRTSITDVWTPL